MLVPVALRLHHTPHSPSMEKSASYFRGQIVCLASHRHTFHPAVCLLGRKNKLKSLASRYRKSSEIHIIYTVFRADGFPGPLNIALMVEWENAAWMLELAQWRPLLSPGHGFQGFVQMRAEGPEDLLESFTSPLRWVRVCACRLTCLRGTVDFLHFWTKCWGLYSQGEAKEVGFYFSLTDTGGWKLIQYLIQKSLKWSVYSPILIRCLILSRCTDPNTSTITYQTQLW